jgi:putative aldouronate transport system permease protein
MLPASAGPPATPSAPSPARRPANPARRTQARSAQIRHAPPQRAQAQRALARRPGGSVGSGGSGALRRQIWAHRHYYLLLLPAFAYICLFSYAPLYGLQIAFKDFYGSLGILGSPWVGLKHFSDFFNGFYFWRTFGNTIILSALTLAVNFPVPIVLALMLNELKSERYKKFAQTALYAPHFISTVVLVGIMHTIFSPSIGVVNTVLEALGHERVYFMALPKLFRGIYVISGAWQEMGWSAIIYIAALAGVDPALHESARMDGATRVQRIIHINLPCISTTIVMLLIISIVNLINSSHASAGFEKIFLMQNEVNLEVSEVISTLVYKRGIINNRMSYSAAVGLFNNVVNLALLLSANFIAGRLNGDSLF